MNHFQTHIDKIKNHLLAVLALFITLSVNAQFYNKQYVAKILVKKDSEFFTFTATAENLTPTDLNLKYDFSVYNTDDDGNISRSNQSDLFFIKGNEIKTLSSAIVNYNATGKVTLVLVLYSIDGKPVGQDRLELSSKNGHQELIIDEKSKQEEPLNQDQAAPQDGFILDGLVVENTLTKAGRDFYKYFYSEYYNRGIKTIKNIVIEEVPGRMRSTRISVKIDDQILWQFFSQPKKSFLQSMASTALNRCIAYLQQLQKQKENSLTRY